MRDKRHGAAFQDTGYETKIKARRIENTGGVNGRSGTPDITPGFSPSVFLYSGVQILLVSNAIKIDSCDRFLRIFIVFFCWVDPSP